MFMVLFLSSCMAFSEGNGLKLLENPKNQFNINYGDAAMARMVMFSRYNNFRYGNLSATYYFRPIKWIWIGVNGGAIMGIENYKKRVYYADPSVKYEDFTEEKPHICWYVAPELKLSYLNGKVVTLYSSLSVGYAREKTFEPVNRYYWHVSYFSAEFSVANFIIGAELGVGYKGFANLHVGYRF